MIAWLNRHTSMRGRLSLTLILLIVLPLVMTSAWRLRSISADSAIQTEALEDHLVNNVALRLEESAAGFLTWLDLGLTDLKFRAARGHIPAHSSDQDAEIVFVLADGVLPKDRFAPSHAEALGPWLALEEPRTGYLAMPPLDDADATPTLFQVAVHPVPTGPFVLALRDIQKEVVAGRWNGPAQSNGVWHAFTVGGPAIALPRQATGGLGLDSAASRRWAEMLGASGEGTKESFEKGEHATVAKPLEGLDGDTVALALVHAEKHDLIPLVEFLPAVSLEGFDRGTMPERGRLMIVVGLIALIGVILCVGMGLVAPQWIWSDVRDSTDRIFGSVARLREIVARNGRALNEQVHSVRQLKESVTVLEQASHSIDASTKAMAESAEQSARVSQSGNRTASVAQRAVLDVRDQVADISELMDQLGHRCREIGGILGHIDQINEGTRKLSVNATIKAGEPSVAARQLSFVAGEMRELAEQALDSTQDIEKRISEIQESSARTLDATRKGRGEVDRCLEAFEELEQAFSSILRWVDETTQFAHGIETATSSQTESLKTVSGSVAALKRRAAETEGNFRDIEDAIDELATLGEEMMEHWKVG